MRVGVVNDVPLTMENLKNIIHRQAGFEVIWCAWNGIDALRYCEKELPDIILMDLFMPEMGGIEATRIIMNRFPCPILIVTASVDATSDSVFEAMGAGAIDAISTPRLALGEMTSEGHELLRKIKMIGSLTRSYNNKDNQDYLLRSQASKNNLNKNLVVIGSSSGGPEALATILCGLPDSFESPIVIIQHVDSKFATGLVRWLNDKCTLEVKAARSGDIPMRRTVYIAAEPDHLQLSSSLTFRYSKENQENYYQPSIDVFFYSVERNWPYSVTGILLTGMGSDGAKGLLALRQRGAYTVSQDENTSAVFGMPKVAADIGAATEVLPIHKIAKAICQH